MTTEVVAEREEKQMQDASSIRGLWIACTVAVATVGLTATATGDYGGGAAGSGTGGPGAGAGAVTPSAGQEAHPRRTAP